jgi:hypothetical protein
MVRKLSMPDTDQFCLVAQKKIQNCFTVEKEVLFNDGAILAHVQ